jgi:hypothetical protein
MRPRDSPDDLPAKRRPQPYREAAVASAMFAPLALLKTVAHRAKRPGAVPVKSAWGGPARHNMPADRGQA